ncbi:MAG: T9SS type A sorting domain-containing protein [Saprospiraceae bacterium]|nr:T9SS type A sorting domain-containing protein [Saprospiraceae bacterium]
MLRISYEIIKTIDPEAYVAIGGIGYPSFLDAVLRNTDNMDEGKVTTDYPLKGGAYFDVLSYHVYPHIDGSLRSWNNLLKGFVYKRHSDAAAYGVLDLKNEFEEVLFQHGYNGQTYPEKVWIITESNVPRKPLNQGFGTDEAQRNFIIKSLVECQKSDIHQFHIFTLGDKMNFNDAQRLYEEYNLMGIYGNLLQIPYKNAKLNDVGVAYKTTSDLLQKKRFDAAAFERLELAKGVNGGVFKDDQGQQTIVLWAETRADNSESALQVINLRNVLAANKLVKKEWNYAVTKDSSIVDARYVTLTGAPIFLTKLENSTYTGGGNPANPYIWEVFPNPFTSQVNINFEVQVEEVVTLTIYDHIGRPKQILVNQEVLSPGNYSWRLDGETFMSGIYFLEYKTNTKTKKILLIKSL